MDASRALKEAADTIATPTALQLRYLQTLNTIAAERGSTIMFPIPMEIMGQAVSTPHTTHTHTLSLSLFLSFSLSLLPKPLHFCIKCCQISV